MNARFAKDQMIIGAILLLKARFSQKTVKNYYPESARFGPKAGIMANGEAIRSARNAAALSFRGLRRLDHVLHSGHSEARVKADRLFNILGIPAFCEPAVDRRQQRKQNSTAN